MRKLLLTAVLIHFVIAGWHGASHQMVPVPLSGMQTAFVAIVIVALPLVGAALCYSRYALQGAALVCASLFASFVFGLVYHFIVMSPDHISQVPPGPWSGAFVWSSILVALSEAVGAVVGAMEFRRLSRARA